MTTHDEGPALIPKQALRRIRPEEADLAIPIYVVWEITMKCDQPCAHCGSRAGRAREVELSTAEALEVVLALGRLGTREVVLIGGEAYLREDCEQLIGALAATGIQAVMQTGGRALTRERAQRFRDAGLSAVGVSVDGPALVHDKLRGNLGSHRAAIRAIDASREVGMGVSANTQINKLNAHLLRETAAELRAHGIGAWQVQLTGPLGRAADRPEWIVDPWQVVPIIDTLAAIQLEAVAEWERGGREGMPFAIMPSNNVGYFGPHEQVLRSRPLARESHFAGCKAGKHTLGIESDGTIKACPTLPNPYRGSNVRALTLEKIWETDKLVGLSRHRSEDELWGHCATCYYAKVCKGGCTWMAHTTLGRPGNNPFCYHRVTQLRRRGIRERLQSVERAPGVPFDFGRFEIVEEAWPAGEQAP